MGFTLDFLGNLATLVGHVAPLFFGLGLIIATLSLSVGRIEQWSALDSLYFGFITALTVGYGDFRPSRSVAKFLAIVIAVFGLMTSGILVAVAVEAVTVTFAQRKSG